ncbi:hypothetical protein ACN42_g11941, partial [Penicillium freii]
NTPLSPSPKPTYLTRLTGLTPKTSIFLHETPYKEVLAVSI